MARGCKTPCADCPWRTDAPAGHWHPDHFAEIWGNCQDDGINVMVCHKAAKLPAEDQGRLPCRGWLLVKGVEAIGVRLLLIRGVIKPADLRRPRTCPPLYETFEAMLKANGIQPPPQNNHFGRGAVRRLL